MMQQYPDSEPVRRIENEVFDLTNGPIDIFLNKEHLLIVDPARDLSHESRQDLNVGIGCFVIDPETLDVRNDRGFKAIRDGESIVLGRNPENQHRFSFDEKTSRRHVMITRVGAEVRVKDLGSLNGTFIGRSVVAATVGATERTWTEPDQDSGFERSDFTLAGNSIPSDLHPERNEDAFFVDSQKPAVAVFDGVGGRAGSGKASEIAAKSTKRILENSKTVLPVGLSLLVVKEALETAHKAVLEEGQLSGIATTATVAKLFKDLNGAPYAAIASVGDSRAYLWRDNELSFLTLDKAYEISPASDKVHKLQDTLARVVDLSQLSDEEANAFRRRNVIDSALGLESSPMINAMHVMLQPGDKILVTSDGIHDNLTTDEIESEVSHTPDHQLAGSLTNAAWRRSNEGHLRSKADDMTTALLTYLG